LTEQFPKKEPPLRRLRRAGDFFFWHGDGDSPGEEFAASSLGKIWRIWKIVQGSVEFICVSLEKMMRRFMFPDIST
jgi:hypothetical protein